MESRTDELATRLLRCPVGCALPADHRGAIRFPSRSPSLPLKRSRGQRLPWMPSIRGRTTSHRPSRQRSHEARAWRVWRAKWWLIRKAAGGRTRSIGAGRCSRSTTCRRKSPPARRPPSPMPAGRTTLSVPRGWRITSRAARQVLVPRHSDRAGRRRVADVLVQEIRGRDRRLRASTRDCRAPKTGTRCAFRILVSIRGLRARPAREHFRRTGLALPRSGTASTSRSWRS